MKAVVASGCFPMIPKEATWVQRGLGLCINVEAIVQTQAHLQSHGLPSMNLIVRRRRLPRRRRIQRAAETTWKTWIYATASGNEARSFCNPAMEAVHWGEAPDLRTFWRKEVGVASGNLSGVLSHGLRWDEMPSLGYPLYVLCCVFLTVLSIFVDLWYQHLLLAPLSLILLVLPALLLALNTARLAKQPASILKLFLLYALYGFARAYAILKSSTALPMQVEN